MKNQLKQFFDLKAFDEYFKSDGPQLSVWSLSLWAAGLIGAMFILFRYLQQAG